jgi:hypothetical protein
MGILIFPPLQHPHHPIIRIHLNEITILQNLRRDFRADDAGILQL